MSASVTYEPSFFFVHLKRPVRLYCGLFELLLELVRQDIRERRELYCLLSKCGQGVIFQCSASHIITIFEILIKVFRYLDFKNSQNAESIVIFIRDLSYPAPKSVQKFVYHCLQQSHHFPSHAQRTQHCKGIAPLHWRHKSYS